MTDLSSNVAAAAPQTIPDDLRVWIGEGLLVELALEVTSGLELGGLLTPGPESVEERLSGPMMCTLLTYWYATGRYASDQLEASVETDPTVRYLCANRCPSAQAIRRFRRLNRVWLQVCLHQLLETAWRGRLEQLTVGCDSAAGPGTSGRLVAAPCGPSSPAFAQAAEQRLRRAVHADTMAADV